MRTKQKILQLSKQRLLTVSFAVIFNLLLAGSVCGTFAWYTYATRAGFEKQYHGVTVGDTGLLETGLVSLVELPDYSDFELVEDKETLADEGKIIYWCNNEIDSMTLRYVLNANGSGTDSMHPVTTGSDSNILDTGFHLYRAPDSLFNYELNSEWYADETDYVHISFVFRYQDPELETPYAPNKKVYFTGCEVQTSDDSPEKEVYKSIRVFAESKETSFIINPSAESDGDNRVGGILDLNKDGFYDYDIYGYERLYGESESYSYNTEVTQSDGSLSPEERTTFVANHKKDKYALNEDTYVPKTVSYKCMKQFVDKDLSISETSADYHYLASLEFYVYSEGWDLHVIDEEDGSGFNMAINFEVNP